MKALLIGFALSLTACGVNKSCCSTQSASEQGLKIVVLMGQSNMSGRGALTEVPESAYPNRDQVLNFVSGAWIPAQDPLDQDDDEAGVGPGLALASDLAGALQSRIGIVQCAKGGTSLAQWHASLFADCMRTVKQALRSGELLAVFWYQGESDAYSDSVAQAWPTQFGSLNAQFKVPVIYAQLSTLGQSAQSDVRFAHWSTVQQAQRRAQGLMIETSDLEVSSDGIHLTTASAITVGHRMAEAYLGGR